MAPAFVSWSAQVWRLEFPSALRSSSDPVDESLTLRFGLSLTGYGVDDVVVAMSPLNGNTSPYPVQLLCLPCALHLRTFPFLSVILCSGEDIVTGILVGADAMRLVQQDTGIASGFRFGS